MEVIDFELKRKQLVEFMKSSGVLRSPEAERAFLNVKRELFFPHQSVEFAYADDAFPIGLGQTISQPSTIAVMLEMLQAKEGMNVLEVGSGCGYGLALLSELVGENGWVFGTELLHGLMEKSRRNLELQGCTNVEVVEGDGSRGLSEKSPFDRVLVSAACPFLPKPLFDQLEEGGTAVAPIGDSFTQQMVSVRKVKGKPLKKPYLQSMFRFVPLKLEMP